MSTFDVLRKIDPLKKNVDASLIIDRIFGKSVDFIKEISKYYGKLPWVIGFSGGKDSTTVVHIVMEAIKRCCQCFPSSAT